MVVIKSPAPPKPPFWKTLHLGRIGTALGIAVPVMIVALWLIAGPFVDRRAQQRQKDTEQAARDWARAALNFAAAHEGHLPNASNWEYALMGKVGKLSADAPPLTDGKPRHWTYNRLLSDRKVEAGLQPRDAVLLYESVATARNASDTLEALPPPTEQAIVVVAFADGHVESITDRDNLRQRNHFATRALAAGR